MMLALVHVHVGPYCFIPSKNKNKNKKDFGSRLYILHVFTFML